MAETLTPVPFHGDTLYLLEHAGEPYVPVRPICEALGLEWERQRKKLAQGRFAQLTRLCTAVAQDGKRRDMLCIPLRKLPGWLYAISPAKVRPDIRPKLERYQDECDEVLWRHWQGQGTRGVEMPPLPEGSRFVPVRVDGVWHFLIQVPGPRHFGESLYVALRPAAEKLGLAWPATRDEVMATREMHLSCSQVPRRWGVVAVGDELGRSLEPDHPIGPDVVTCIPLHELVPLAHALAPYPPVAEAAAALGERLLQGWHAHVTGGVLPGPDEPEALPQPGGHATARLAGPVGRTDGAARFGPLPDDELAEMRRLCIEGATFQAIGRALGRSHHAVRWALRGMAVHDPGLPARAGGILRGLDDEALIRLRAQRASGRSLSSIAREAGAPGDLLSIAFRGMDFARETRQ
ncbi:MAG TPA: hypothetical protein ENK57_22810 [Polyangiaceae bacterium]|nr:hypothetical protein [Polyangiaceae bacterium]